jgi:hypothetical protein
MGVTWYPRLAAFHLHGSTLSMLLVARNPGTPLEHPSFLLNQAQIMSPNLLEGLEDKSLAAGIILKEICREASFGVRK